MKYILFYITVRICLKRSIYLTYISISASLSYCYFAQNKKERESKSVEACTKQTLLNGKYLCARFLYLSYLCIRIKQRERWKNIKIRQSVLYILRFKRKFRKNLS